MYKIAASNLNFLTESRKHKKTGATERAG